MPARRISTTAKYAEVARVRTVVKKTHIRVHTRNNNTKRIGHCDIRSGAPYMYNARNDLYVIHGEDTPRLGTIRRMLSARPSQIGGKTVSLRTKYKITFSASPPDSSSFSQHLYALYNTYRSVRHWVGLG